MWELVKLNTDHTSIKSLFAPSEIAARLSYCSGSKSFKAEVRYSPAGVVLTFSALDLTKVMAVSVLSEVNGEGTSTARVLTLLSILRKNWNPRVTHHWHDKKLMKSDLENAPPHVSSCNGWSFWGWTCNLWRKSIKVKFPVHIASMTYACEETPKINAWTPKSLIRKQQREVWKDTTA